MSEIFLPSLNNKFIDKRNKSNNKIKTNLKNNNVDNFRTYLLGNNSLNYFMHNKLKKEILNNSVNHNKSINNLTKTYSNKKSKNNNNTLKVFYKNKTVLDLDNIYNDINKKPYILFNNKSYNNINLNKFINKTENIYKNRRKINNLKLNYKSDNTINNNHNYINTDIYNNIKYNNSSKNIIDNKFKKNNKSIEVQKIIDLLINSKKEDYENIFLKNQNENIKFPKNKTVDPFSYINYNLKKNPYDKTLYKGLNKIMKKMKKESLKEEFENELIQKSTEVNNLRLDSNHIEAPLGEAKKVKEQCEDMLSQIKKYKSFSFNKNENPQKHIKMKIYKPYGNILNKNYKNYFNKIFKIQSNEINNKKTNSDLELEKNIDKYISFDMRINNILYISRNTENNINRKSKEHEEMLNKFSFILNSYFK